MEKFSLETAGEPNSIVMGKSRVETASREAADYGF